MDATEHRPRRLRWWLCRCGDRFPCGPLLAHLDREARRERPPVVKSTGVNIRVANR